MSSGDCRRKGQQGSPVPENPFPEVLSIAVCNEQLEMGFSCPWVSLLSLFPGAAAGSVGLGAIPACRSSAPGRNHSTALELGCLFPGMGEYHVHPGGFEHYLLFLQGFEG